MFNVRMSEVIESASAHAHAPELTDATPAAGGRATTASSRAPSMPPSIVLSTVPMKPAAQSSAQPLQDRHWCMSSQLPFVPEHFLALPDSLGLPPVGQSDWCDPQGPQTARINATPLSLRPDDAERPGRSRTSRDGVTNWSQLMKQPVVLQMQSVVEPNSRAAGGFATALLASGTTDLIAVDALVRHPDAERMDGPGTVRSRTPALTKAATGYPVAFPVGNPVTGAVTDGFDYAFPAGAPFTSVKTSAVAPNMPRDGVPQGQLTISLEGADGSRTEHPVRTHTLNLNAPDWVHRLLYALNVRFLESGKQPLQLALMCKDGATASGVVATALHGMECLESLNRGDIQLPDEAALATRLDQFILAGQSVRSPAFSQVGGKPVDTQRMARDLWHAWASVQSKPDSLAVQTLRKHQIDQGVWLEMDDTTPLLDAVDGNVTTTESTKSSGQRMTRLSRLLSSGSEDSGVLSDTTHASSRFSTLARGRGAAALPSMDEVRDGEGDPWETSPAATLTRGLSEADGHALPESVNESLNETLNETVGEAVNDSVTSSTDALAAPNARTRQFELPATEGMRARIFHPAHKATDAKVRAMLADLTTPASATGSRLRSASPTTSSDTTSSAMSSAMAAARAKPALTPLQTALHLSESRSAAETATSAELSRIPRHIRKDWMPGGAKFDEFLPRLDGLAKEMTARTGLIGYLRARFSDPLTRKLEPHTHWARDLIEQIQAQMTRDLESQAGPSSEGSPEVDQTVVALAAHDAVKRLVARRFEQLTPREQARWCERVEGRSPRFNQALSSSQQRVHELARQFSPNSAEAAAPLTAQSSSAPPVFMHLFKRRSEAAPSAADGDSLAQRRNAGARSPESLRQMVDREWSTHWVLNLTRDVAGLRR